MTATVTAASGYDLGYIWKGQGGGATPETSAGGYYINAAQAGEAPGRWAGRGLDALGIPTGQEVDRGDYEAVYRQVHPLTGEQLGRKPGGYLKFRDHLDRLVAAEPYATAERLLELERQAAQETRKSPSYTDVTVSFSKSLSVFHASLRENARRARMAGDLGKAAYWDGQVARYQEILQQANAAGMAHLQEWVGTRTGYQGIRHESAGLVITSWLQGTSRDGDPQDHVHNQIARMAYTDADGKWRAVDTMAIRAQLNAVQATVVAHGEAALTQEYGLKWRPRADGLGREIDGITQAQMDAYSSRTQAIKEQTPKAVAAWVSKYGRVPNERELLYIQQEVTMATRKGKEPDEIDWDELARKWDETLGGQLASIAPSVSRLGPPDADAETQGPETQPPDATPETQDAGRRDDAIRTGLSAVQTRRATWTRADLMREITANLPAAALRLGPDEAVALVHELTDRALSGAVQQVRELDAPEYPATPDYLVRELDGRSVYSRPGVTRYATHVQISREEALIEAARQPAPALEAQESAELLGSATADLDEAARTRAHEASAVLPGGLRMDQAAALHHALTDPRSVSVIVGPAGSGKTRVLAEAARIWQETGRPVIGIAPSQAARNVLAKAAGVECWNTAQFLGHSETERGVYGARDLQPGTLILLDEGSMTSTQDMQDVISWAAQHHCKVMLAGDHGQLTAVEGGGGMQLLGRELGYAQLATPVRFTEAWERDASLRLRAGDATVLAEEYDQHGRLRGGPGDAALEDARRAYVAAYLDGRDALVMAQSHEVCTKLSERIRDDLVHLGLVSDGPSVRLRGGARASVGDLITTRENDHGKGIANGDTWQVTSIRPSGQVIMHRLTDPDQDTGERRFEDQGVLFDDFTTAELAYVVTAHSAQGRTVAEGHALLTGTEDREWVYVAMSRGMFSNSAYVVTGSPRAADPEGPTRAAPELERYERLWAERAGLPVPAQPVPENHEETSGKEYLAVMSACLDRPGAELSAMEARDTNLANADHLGILHAIYQAESMPARNAHYEAMVREALPAGFETAPTTHTAQWLWRSLRAAEAAGLDPQEVVDRAVSRQSLAGAQDVWAVLDARVRDDTASLIPAAPAPWADRVPETGDEARQDYLSHVAAAMDDRKARLGAHTAQTAPAWAIAGLGPVPEDPVERLDWEQRASHVAAYRELFGYDHATEPVGPEPDGDSPEKRQAWHAAFAALGPVDGVDLRGEQDGRLLRMRATYAAETAWAPRWVGDELRHVRLGVVDAETAASNAVALAKAARERGDDEVAARHEEHARSAQAMSGIYQGHEGKLADTMAAREEWERATEGTRRLAVAADTELRRRHPETKLDQLRSAEPDRVTEAERLALDVETEETPAWVTELAGRNRAVRAEVDDRHSQRMPDEDHEYADAEAWPEIISRERDAVLQPPRVEILPAPEVVRMAAEREADQAEQNEGGE